MSDESTQLRRRGRNRQAILDAALDLIELSGVDGWSMRELAGRDHTSRRDLELAAASHGVLPDGALDVINEAALDLTGDLVIETHDDESVTVDPDAYEEMCA